MLIKTKYAILVLHQRQEPLNDLTQNIKFLYKLNTTNIVGFPSFRGVTFTLSF